MAFDRRSFLKALGLTSVGLVLHQPDVAAQPENLFYTDLSTITLEGMVKSNGKGIAGVAVTDGINVVLTDSNGKYKLASNASAEFVYISIPAGFAFPHVKGITGFYKKVDHIKPVFTADFELQKLSGDDSKHTFIVWADPQIQTVEDARLLNAESAPDTRALIDSLGANALVHGIGCGDLVWDRFDLFPDYKLAIEKTGIPFFQVIGNHDMDIDSRTDDMSSTTFKNHFGPSYYSFNRGKVHYVVLDDVFFLGTSKKYIGYITEQQFSWLEQDLKQVKPGSTVVVSLHIPVNTGAMRRNGLKEESIGGVVSNRKELYRILKPYNAHIMSGHTHFNEKVMEGENIIEHVHGTVCGAWWTGPICYDGTPNGYAVYEVDGTVIKWYHKAVGQDKNYQMRVYPIGSVPDHADSIAVNVWNWDPNWKVEWFEDGVSRGELHRAVSFDPLSVELHEGIEKPSIRGWVEPVLTDHIFFGKPSPSTQTITILVTDRFNNQYKSEIGRKEFEVRAPMIPHKGIGTMR